MSPLHSVLSLALNWPKIFAWQNGQHDLRCASGHRGKGLQETACKREVFSSGTAEAVFGLVWLVVSSHGAPTDFMVGVREHESFLVAAIIILAQNPHCICNFYVQNEIILD